MSKSYYRVFFSSNSQLCFFCWHKMLKCQRATIVFSFQAIHNISFKSFCWPKMSKSYYRVFFSSNSQLVWRWNFLELNVKELLSCFLFKQFTTPWRQKLPSATMSKSYYRVFFSSNSQLFNRNNENLTNVKELLSCFLFKQFTTRGRMTRFRN